MFDENGMSGRGNNTRDFSELKKLERDLLALTGSEKAPRRGAYLRRQRLVA
jgi:hypothetical protein